MSDEKMDEQTKKMLDDKFENFAKKLGADLNDGAPEEKREFGFALIVAPVEDNDGGPVPIRFFSYGFSHENAVTLMRSTAKRVEADAPSHQLTEMLDELMDRIKQKVKERGRKDATEKDPVVDPPKSNGADGSAEAVKASLESGTILKTGWEKFREFLMRKGYPESQIESMKAAFYIGADHLWSAIFAMVDGPEPTKEDLERMEKVHNEIESFRLDTIASTPGTRQ